MDGYINIHRQLIDSPVFANPNHLKIWIWILMKANFKDRTISVKIGGGYTSVEIKRGQMIFGRHTAEEELGLSGSMIYRALQKFEEWQMLKITANNQFSIITVCNYDTYQSQQQESEQRVNSERTASEPDVNQTRTRREPDVNTLKKDNNVNKDKKDKKVGDPPESESFLDQIPRNLRESQVMQQLSTTVIPDDQKKMYYLRLEANDFCRNISGSYHRIKISQVRPDAEYLFKKGWLKTDQNTNYKPSINYDEIIRQSEAAVKAIHDD